MPTNIGGKTRVYYKIDLPPNTLEWYYIFTTTPNTNNNSLQLFTQLSNILYANSIASIAASSLSVSSGNAPVDVFLMNKKGLDAFLEKSIFGNYEYSRPSHFYEGTVLNAKDGKIKIDDLRSGTFFLGIRNPSLNTGVNVKFEVVAIIEETTSDNTKWSKDIKEKVYNHIINSLSSSDMEENAKIDFATCMMDEITKNISPSDFSELANYEILNILKKYSLTCDKTGIFKF
ncbi:hypothetical protein [Flavobacterium capsici]|uniref:Uncharacterized protein n=1 Tax=Flavobacterium capsici TaxID=3075618 RepID=A0AA96EUE0_9FLAO|nr:MULTISPECIES: hypothetical protein [unclassified Flavobacterium]WNM18504.1 hypothetical protein RN608_10835 [Flavobacterium sp. PMR2A8]WNM22555.1 hypothetical protein RN605_04135 [Flavobacterium sp. PMTSA4]